MVSTTILSVGLGLLLSLFMVECFSLVAGGMIVPGFLALQLAHPEQLLMTLLAALCTFYAVLGLDYLVILYGRRRVTVTLLLGFFFNISFHYLSVLFVSKWGFTVTASIFESSIGYVLPGLIALWFDRQGLLNTVSVISILTFSIRLLLILFVGGSLV